MFIVTNVIRKRAKLPNAHIGHGSLHRTRWSFVTFSLTILAHAHARAHARARAHAHARARAHAHAHISCPSLTYQRLANFSQTSQPD